MVVYGKRRTKYVLSSRPVSGDGEGAVYPVSGRNDILAKIYQKSARTPEKEYQVMDAINGSGTMLGEFPMEIVYQHGKFAGYIFENEERYNQSVEMPVETGSRKTVGALNSTVVVLISIVLSLLMSGMLRFKIYPELASNIQPENLAFYFSGIPILLGGWALMFLVVLKIREMGILAILFSVIAFIAGGSVAFGINWLIIAAIRTTLTIVGAVLPSVILILLLVWGIKKMLNIR